MGGGRGGGEPDGLPDALPAGRQLAVTWGIPDRYGGMTSALLHRSRAFVRLAGRDVDVLTLDPRPGYGELRERLAESGELVRGIRLRNLYDDLRAVGPSPARSYSDRGMWLPIPPMSPRPETALRCSWRCGPVVGWRSSTAVPTARSLCSTNAGGRRAHPDW